MQWYDPMTFSDLISKVYPVAAVEIEVSPWSYEEETKKVIETTKKLGIPVIAYS